jgi:hypothetical protein
MTRVLIDRDPYDGSYRKYPWHEYFGCVPNGIASRSCWITQFIEGFGVIANRRTFLRP